MHPVKMELIMHARFIICMCSLTRNPPQVRVTSGEILVPRLLTSYLKLLCDCYIYIISKHVISSFLWHYGWSNSSRVTDPSAASSLSCFHDCVYGVSHFDFLLPNAWNWLVDDNEVKLKRTAFLHFVRTSFQKSFEQYDGASFLTQCQQTFNFGDIKSGFHAKPSLSRLSWTFGKS